MFFNVVSVITMGAMVVFSFLVVSLFYGCIKFMVKYHTMDVMISSKFITTLCAVAFIVFLGIIFMGITVRM